MVEGKIVAYVRNHLDRGHSEEKLRAHLTRHGYHETLIESAIKEAQKPRLDLLHVSMALNIILLLTVAGFVAGSFIGEPTVTAAVVSDIAVSPPVQESTVEQPLREVSEEEQLHSFEIQVTLIPGHGLTNEGLAQFSQNAMSTHAALVSVTDLNENTYHISAVLENGGTVEDTLLSLDYDALVAKTEIVPG